MTAWWCHYGSDALRGVHARPQHIRSIVMLSSSCNLGQHMGILSSCHHHPVSSMRTSSCCHRLISTDASSCSNLMSCTGTLHAIIIVLRGHEPRRVIILWFDRPVVMKSSLRCPSRVYYVCGSQTKMFDRLTVRSMRLSEALFSN